MPATGPVATGPQAGGAQEREAFQSWARARAPALRRTAFQLCGDWHHAEDLTQETLIRLANAWPQIRDRDATDAYARRTLLNQFNDRRRRRSSGERPMRHADLTEREDLPPAAQDHAEGVLVRLTLTRALARMPRSRRAVLVLRYLEDLPIDEVAARLGCSPGNVKSQASRGLSALRLDLT